MNSFEKPARKSESSAYEQQKERKRAKYQQDKADDPNFLANNAEKARNQYHARVSNDATYRPRRNANDCARRQNALPLPPIPAAVSSNPSELLQFADKHSERAFQALTVATQFGSQALSTFSQTNRHQEEQPQIPSLAASTDIPSSVETTPSSLTLTSDDCSSVHSANSLVVTVHGGERLEQRDISYERAKEVSKFGVVSPNPKHNDRLIVQNGDIRIIVPKNNPNVMITAIQKGPPLPSRLLPRRELYLRDLVHRVIRDRSGDTVCFGVTANIVDTLDCSNRLPQRAIDTLPMILPTQDELEQLTFVQNMQKEEAWLLKIGKVAHARTKVEVICAIHYFDPSIIPRATSEWDWIGRTCNTMLYNPTLGAVVELVREAKDADGNPVALYDLVDRAVEARIFDSVVQHFGQEQRLGMLQQLVQTDGPWGTSFYVLKADTDTCQSAVDKCRLLHAKLLSTPTSPSSAQAPVDHSVRSHNNLALQKVAVFLNEFGPPVERLLESQNTAMLAFSRLHERLDHDVMETELLFMLGALLKGISEGLARYQYQRRF